MTTRADASGLAFKAYEIEELIDVYLFRRLGIVVARAAKVARLSPNAVSVLAGVVGAAGGLLLVRDRWEWFGVALFWAHGVFDSADGQLARLTGQTSEWGRVLDGLAGYATHIAAYIGIVLRVTHDGGSWWILGAGVAAGAATIVHAQFYDYHRTAYAAIVVKGRPSAGADEHRPTRGLVGVYERTQQRLAGLHPAVERAVAAAAAGGTVPDSHRQQYREYFLRLMPAWNLFGDNMRRYGVLVCTALGHLGWFFGFILLLTIPLAFVWLVQRRADARFLASVRAATPGATRS